jgi:hypothetical protein
MQRLHNRLVAVLVSLAGPLAGPWAALALAVPGHAQAQSAPAGFQAVPHQAASGTALLHRVAATGTGKPSARQLAQQALQALAPVLDRAPRLLSGMASREDDEAMMSFAGHWRGTLVQGYIVAKVAPQGAVVAVALDEPQHLARTGPALLAAADAAAFPAGSQGQGASPYRNLSWSTVSFGSGQVSLPQGWRVVGAHQGAVDIVGPQGEVASLGAASQVTTPQTAQYWAARGLPPQTFVAPASGNPVEAFRSVQPQIERFTASRGGPVVRVTNVREAERIPFGNFNAALVASDGVGSIGNRPYRKLSLVAAGGVMANGNWLYYNSEVYAPAELYPHALPVLLKIWNSWSVDKNVLMERLVSAAKSMRETNEILRSTQGNRDASNDRLSAAWGHHLRGTVVVSDSNTGRQSTEWLYQPGPAANGVGLEHNRHMSTVVRDANAAAGYERWQVVNP